MKESVVFYKSFYEAIKNIPEEEQLQLYNAIFEYSFNGTEPAIENGIVKGMFMLMKPNIDSANARYKANVENGKRGGRPKKETQKNPTKTQTKPNKNPNETQIEPKQNLNVDVDVDVDDNVDVNDNDNVDVDINAKITKCYELNIGTITPAEKEVLFKYINYMDYRLIIIAIKKASINNQKKACYIDGILADWKNKGYKTLEDIGKERKPKKLNSNYNQREYENLDSLYTNLKEII